MSLKWEQWNPSEVTVDSTVPDNAWKTCVIQGVYFADNEFNGGIGGRVSAIFVIMATSLIATLFPVVSRRISWLKINEIAYVMAKMFGSGVIVATAFIHLMEPAYSQIGSQSCVGMTGNWAEYTWCPAIMLASAVFIFIVDIYCDFFADIWYGVHNHTDAIPGVHDEEHDSNTNSQSQSKASFDAPNPDNPNASVDKTIVNTSSVQKRYPVDSEFYSQFAGFLILEFGVLFHSVMIGLTLGSSSEYRTLYPVLVFHQAFEGLGIGARLSAIPFSKERQWWPFGLATAYSLTTPISIAIGLGVRQSYRDSGFTASVVQGVLNAISAGILLYTGFVELLARDFIFNPTRTKSIKQLNLQLVLFLLGAGLMALLGEWA